MGIRLCRGIGRIHGEHQRGRGHEPSGNGGYHLVGDLHLLQRLHEECHLVGGGLVRQDVSVALFHHPVKGGIVRLETRRQVILHGHEHHFFFRPGFYLHGDGGEHLDVPPGIRALDEVSFRTYGDRRSFGKGQHAVIFRHQHCGSQIPAVFRVAYGRIGELLVIEGGIHRKSHMMRFAPLCFRVRGGEVVILDGHISQVLSLARSTFEPDLQIYVHAFSRCKGELICGLFDSDGYFRISRQPAAPFVPGGHILYINGHRAVILRYKPALALTGAELVGHYNWRYPCRPCSPCKVIEGKCPG